MLVCKKFSSNLERNFKLKVSTSHRAVILSASEESVLIVKLQILHSVQDDGRTRKV